MIKILRRPIVVLCAVLATASHAEIEEIVVTAEKREASLQDTSIAITAFSTDDIKRDRVEDFRQIALQTPNLVYAETAGFSLVTLRGVGLDVTTLAGEAAVAVYTDGVYQGQTFIQGIPSFDLERIEVLRGPQGTLYGRNATGGGVNFVSKLPGQEFEINAALTLEDHERRKGEFGVNIPFSDQVAFRASVVQEIQDEGFRENILTGQDVDENDVFSARATLLITPSDTLEIILRGDYTDQERTGLETENIASAPNSFFATPSNVGGFLSFPDPALGGLSLADVFGLDIPSASVPTISDPDDLELTTNGDIVQDGEVFGYSATVTWDINETLQFKSITGYRDSEYRRLSDSDGLDLTLLHANNVQTSEQFTQELTLSGTALEGDLTWIVGGYYFDDEAEAAFLFDLDDFQVVFEALFGLPGGAPLPSGSLAFFAPRIDGTPSAAPFLDFLQTQDSESIAAFAQATYAFNEEWSITGGIRRTEDEKDVERTITANIVGPDGICTNLPEDDEWSQTTGTLGLDFQPTDNSLYYAKYSTGYKAGGFNPGECTGSFDPEEITAFEVGSKNQWFDNRLQVNAAAFYYDYEDIQITRFIQSASRIENAAVAEVMGLEVEFVAQFSGWGIDGSISWLDTEYDDATFSDPIAGGAPIDVSGNSLIRAPDLSATLGIQYTWPAFGGELTLRGDASYKDNYYFDVFEASLPNQSELEQDSYVITNARLGWRSDSSPWQIQAFFENIGDEIYAEGRQAAGTTGAVIAQFSRPRNFGVRFAYSPQ